MNKQIKKQDLTKEIAKEVAKLVLPRLKQFIVEQNKKVLGRTKRIIKEELEKQKPIAEDIFDEDDLFNEDENSDLRTHIQPKQIIKQKPVSQQNGKLRAKEILDAQYSNGNGFDPTSIDGLIESAVVPSKQDMIEGGDRTFKATELVEAKDVNTAVDPGNMDFSDIVDEMDSMSPGAV